jgi:hypothetical protein
MKDGPNRDSLRPLRRFLVASTGMPSEKAKEFRKRAKDCRLKAQQSEDPNSKAFWLHLAKGWERSAEKESVSAQSDCLST